MDSSTFSCHVQSLNHSISKSQTFRTVRRKYPQGFPPVELLEKTNQNKRRHFVSSASDASRVARHSAHMFLLPTQGTSFLGNPTPAHMLLATSGHDGGGPRAEMTTLCLARMDLRVEEQKKTSATQCGRKSQNRISNYLIVRRKFGLFPRG